MVAITIAPSAITPAVDILIDDALDRFPVALPETLVGGGVLPVPGDALTPQRTSPLEAALAVNTALRGGDDARFIRPIRDNLLPEFIDELLASARAVTKDNPVTPPATTEATAPLAAPARDNSAPAGTSSGDVFASDVLRGITAYRNVPAVAVEFPNALEPRLIGAGNDVAAIRETFSTLRVADSGVNHSGERFTDEPQGLISQGNFLVNTPENLVTASRPQPFSTDFSLDITA